MMNERSVVVLFGDSLRLDSLAVCLRHESGLDVVRLDSVNPYDNELCPDMVLFDLDAADALSVFTRFRSKPVPALVGLSLTEHKAVLFTGQPRMVGVAIELGQVIGGNTRNCH